MSYWDQEKKNLLKDIQLFLEDNNLLESDIQWVGNLSGDLAISFKDFKTIAEKTFIHGYKIAHDLTIVAKDWWITVEGVAGCMLWVLHKKPEKSNAKLFVNVKTYNGLRLLKDIQNPNNSLLKEE